MGPIPRIILSLACIALIVLSGRQVLALAHLELASDIADDPGKLTHVRAATALSPWTTSHWERAAATEMDHSRAINALHASRNAVRLAPVDARAWHEHARRLVRTRQYGPELAASIARIIDLAPASPVLRLEQALLAARHWPRAGPDARRIWEENAKHVAQTQMEDFARLAAAVEMDVGACALAGDVLTVWCKNIDAWREACDQPGLRPRQLRGCRNLGLR